jgi:hypothetical protein
LTSSLSTQTPAEQPSEQEETVQPVPPALQTSRAPAEVQREAPGVQLPVQAPPVQPLAQAEAKSQAVPAALQVWTTEASQRVAPGLQVSASSTQRPLWQP